MIKNKSYRIGILFGIILISIVIGFFPFLIYFFLIPIVLLILFIILLWLTNYTIYPKLSFSLLPFIIIPACIFFWKQINTIEPEIFLIPNSYKGKVRIIFNQNCGEPKKYEGERRVFKIPNDGILLTQFKDEQGFINQSFYVLENGRRKRIEQLRVQEFNEEWTLEKNLREPSRNTLAIFEAGRTYSDGSSEFFICTYNEFRKYDIKYDQRFDSLVIAKKSDVNKNCK